MDDKLIEIFYEESQEIVEALEQGLLDLEGSDSSDLINAVFRAAHTMKGNAGIVGFEDVVELTHHMESLLDEMRNGHMKPDGESVGVLLGALDALKVMIDSHLHGQVMQTPTEVLAALTRLLGIEPDSAPKPSSWKEARPVPEPSPPATPSPPDQPRQEASTSYRIVMRFRPDLFLTGTDPILLLLELEELGSISDLKCHAENLPALDQLKPDSLYLWWELTLSTNEPFSTLQNVFIFVIDENNISIERVVENAEGSGAWVEPVGPPPGQGASQPLSSEQKPPDPDPGKTSNGAGDSSGPKPDYANQAEQSKPGRTPQVHKHIPSTIRVDTAKLDKLVNLVGELAINMARIHQLTGDDVCDELGLAFESMDHISRDLQEQIMRVRMIPVEGTFNRFQRLVHNLAQELGKSIRLQMSGIETELDKNLTEQITDPLKHLIRNSADHGLESPEQRRADGKPETGTIWLKAYQREGRIVIEVSDDGRGIDREKLLQEAVERGLCEPGAPISPAQVYSFMFQAGFSTASQVTELSGRGVGLDVVRQNIESLQGSVEVESTVGKGTTFRIKLPLTLAIIDGMMVRVGDEILTLPLLSIVESIRPRPGEVHFTEATGEMVSVRGGYLPLIRLHQVFDFPAENTDPHKSLVVILEGVGSHFGILVDDILGEQQAVIKSLEKNYRKVAGIAGATILGNGRVSLILDIHGLEKLVLANQQGIHVAGKQS